MMALLIKNTALSLALIVVIAVLPTCIYPAYALPVGPHGQPVLADRQANGTQPAPFAAFLCASFGHARAMARLRGETVRSAGLHLHRSANPSQSCHPYLAVSGKTSFKQMES